MFKLPRFKKPKDTIIDFQFGGFYAVKDEDGYGVIRLLDLPGDSYHYQMFDATFPKVPSFEQIESLKPFILHVPMEIAALIGKEITLIGHRPLTSDDLQGYAFYLEEMGADEQGIKAHFEQLISLSANQPSKMRLFIENGEVLAEHL